MTTRRMAMALGGGMLAAVLAAAPAAAHVTANPNQAAAGSYAFFEFRVGHGCGDEPTTEVSVQIPAEVESVTPEVQPGWEIELVRGEQSDGATEPGDEGSGGGHGGDQGRVQEETPGEEAPEEVTHGPSDEAPVTEVRWTGGSLPSDRVDHFGMSVKLADGIDAEAVFFPTVQRCPSGAELAWTELPPDGEPAGAFFGEAESPAPFVLISASQGGHGGGDEPAGSEAAIEGASASSSDEGDSDTLAVVALILGALGLLAGAGAFVRAGSARSSGT